MAEKKSSKPGTSLIVKAAEAGTPGREKMGRDLSADMIDRVVADMSSTLLRPGNTRAMGPQKPWFDPMQPIAPLAQEAAYGRQFDFRAGYNLNIQPRPDEATSFLQLRALAESFDILRLIIETRKDQVESYEWEIMPTEEFEDDQQVIDDAKRATEFMQEPDRQNPFTSWLRMILEDLFVLDAVAILPRRTRGGQLWGFELMDGATIQKLIDSTGRTPLPPDPAYRSILHGVPAASYTQDDVRYYMRNPRTWKVYGYGPVEQIIMTVNIAIRRQLSQLQFYTEGNIPEALSGVPEGWTVEQIQQFQLYWDSMLEGNTAERRHMKFVPMDPTKILLTKGGETLLSDAYDEWLARICCFAFSIPPTPFVKQQNRATAATAAESSKQEGLIPLLTWLSKVMTRLVVKDLGIKNVEFKWKMEEAVDPVSQATIDQIYIECKVKTPDEVREEQGMTPLTDEQRLKAFPQPAGPGLDAAGNPLPVPPVAKPGAFGKPAAAAAGKPAAASGKEGIKPKPAAEAEVNAKQGDKSKT